MSKLDLSGNIAIAIGNCRKWMVHTNLSTFFGIIGVLHADNRKKFLELYGKQTTTIDHYGRRMYVWEIEFKGETFYLLSAKERGTSYEIKSDWNNFTSKEDVIVEFMLSVYNKLKG